MCPLRFVILLMILAASAAATIADDAPTPQELCDAAEPGELTRMQFAEAETVLKPNTDYRAILCTSAGAIYVDLYEALTPITVNNFVFLAGQGYYDSTTFHRVIPDFMAQGGDPTGSGRGGPGYQFKDEPIGFLTFDRPGLLAMANAGPGTNGGQFFITTAPAPHLNYKHTIFGDVLLGQDIVESIRERDPSTASEPGEALLTVLIITDRSAVDNSDVVELQPATPEQIANALHAGFSKIWPSYLKTSFLKNVVRSGYFSTEELVDSVSADFRDEFADYLEKYGHQYRYRVELVNADCEEPSKFLASTGYQVDVFASKSAAEAAESDEGQRRALESLAYPKGATVCTGEASTRGILTYPIGRFLVSIDVLVADWALERLLDEQGEPILDPRDSMFFMLDKMSREIDRHVVAIFLPEIR